MHEHDCSAPSSFRVTFPGPFESHDVVVDGWRVPFLQAHMASEDRVTLVVDRRLATELSVGEAERVGPLVADAVAVALGYPAHPQSHQHPPLVRDPHPRPVKSMGLFSTGPESQTP